MYTYPPQNLGKGQIENGKNLAALIHIDTEFMKDRNIIDYWLAAHPKKAEKLMKDSENSLKSQEVYKRQIERVPKQEIDAIKKIKELQIAAIYTRFQAATPISRKSLNQ